MDATTPPPSASRSIHTFPPEFMAPGPEEPVLMHEDFRRISRDVAAGLDGVAVLAQLLRTAEVTDPTMNAGSGLAVLLEGVHMRMQLGLDALGEAGAVLGIEGCEQRPCR